MSDLLLTSEPMAQAPILPGGVSKFNAHDRTAGKDEWFTPEEIDKPLGPFDLDPCTAVFRPRDIAPIVYTVNEDGLKKPWHGFVWCNPPYGQETKRWYSRMSEHNNGIMLTFARTETEMFFQSVWGKARGIYFIKRRVTFIERACATCGRGQSIHNPKFEIEEHKYVPGQTFVKGEASAGAPSVLVAYGELAAERILNAQKQIPGYWANL